MWLEPKSTVKLKPKSKRNAFWILVSNDVLLDIKLLRYKTPLLLQRLSEIKSVKCSFENIQNTLLKHVCKVFRKKRCV